MATQTLKRSDLNSIIHEICQPHLLSVQTCTIPDMNKRGNEFWNRVRKLSRFNATLGGYIYEQSVNKRRIKESSPDVPACDVERFRAEARRWGSHATPIGGGNPLKCPAIEHKGKNYIELMIHQVYETNYLLDGQPVNPEILEKIKQFLKKKNGEARQKLINPIVIRDYHLSSVLSIKTGGCEFVLED